MNSVIQLPSSFTNTSSSSKNSSRNFWLDAEKLKAIWKARQQGMTDEQIRKRLLRGGLTKQTARALSLADEAGIKNVLVDTVVMDVPSIGSAAKAIQLVKNKFGLPAGCGPANAITTWKRLKKGEFGQHGYNVFSGGSDIVTQMMGASFILYGPVELAETAFAASAMCDAIVAFTVKKLETTIKEKNHPLYKIF